MAGLAGLGLAGWLLASYGTGRILDLVGQAGWFGIAAVIVFHLSQVLFSASAWRAVSGPLVRRPSLAMFCVLRWVREGVNNLLPVAQIGGEFVVTRLMQRQGVPLAPAIAGVVADLTIEMATQIAFTLLGLGLLLHAVGGGGGIAGSVVGFLAVAVLLVAAVLGAQWFGLAHVFEVAFMRVGRALGWAGAADVEGLHQALLDCYRRSRSVLASVLWHTISWLLGGVEVCLALHFLGHDIDLAKGTVIESLGQALRAAGFAVPGALGLQEGGLVVICGVFGLSPELAIALSLVKRVRELVLGVPALVASQLLGRRRHGREADPALEAAP